jgi:hypothetical protein
MHILPSLPFGHDCRDVDPVAGVMATEPNVRDLEVAFQVMVLAVTVD